MKQILRTFIFPKTFVILIALIASLTGHHAMASKYRLYSGYAIPCFTFSWKYEYSPLDPSQYYYRLRIDPAGFQEFQFDVLFNATYLTFYGAEYVSSYVSASPLDLTAIGAGLIQDVHGATSLAVPPAAPVDIVILDFLPTAYGDEHCLDAIDFTVFLSPNDSIVVMDTVTLATESYDATRLAGFNASSSFGYRARICPDATSWTAEAGGLLGLAWLARRRMSQKR